MKTFTKFSHANPVPFKGDKATKVWVKHPNKPPYLVEWRDIFCFFAPMGARGVAWRFA